MRNSVRETCRIKSIFGGRGEGESRGGRERNNGRISGEILKIRSRQFRVAKIAKFRAEDSLQSLTYLAGSLSTPPCPPLANLLSTPTNSRRGWKGGGGRLQEPRWKDEMLFCGRPPHPENFINCAFCYADALQTEPAATFPPPPPPLSLLSLSLSSVFDSVFHFLSSLSFSLSFSLRSFARVSRVQDL